MKASPAIVLFAAIAALPPIASPYQESAVTFAASQPTAEARAIGSALESYVKAIETKDLALFKHVKPNMTPEEERRAKLAFESVKKHSIAMVIQSVEVQGSDATVKVARRDTLNGSIVSSFNQVFQMSRDDKGWNIREMGR